MQQTWEEEERLFNKEREEIEREWDEIKKQETASQLLYDQLHVELQKTELEVRDIQMQARELFEHYQIALATHDDKAAKNYKGKIEWLQEEVEKASGKLDAIHQAMYELLKPNS